MPPGRATIGGMRTARPPGRPPHPDILTAAEWRVTEAVRHGLSNPAIARRQGVSTQAVKYHVSNILQKLGLASRAQLRTWGGVRRDSHLFGSTSMMTETPALGAIGQIARGVTDIAAASAWYGGTLGLPPLFAFGKLAFFDCQGTRLMLSEGDGTGTNSILYFRVADIHASVAALTARGVRFINAPHMIHRHADGTEEWMAFFQDNENRPLALMSQV